MFRFQRLCPESMESQDIPYNRVVNLKYPQNSKIVMTAIITQKEVKRVLGMDDVIKVVENAFKLHGRGKVQMPAKSYLERFRKNQRQLMEY